MSSHRLILFLLTSCLVACTPRSVREAQDVVAQADSLWAAGQMYGREAGDSATLAQAYATLNTPLSTLTPHLSSSYAHACYHYGRLLREKENPVAAMECFINATHSHTRDYHILGRVYSNMGSICHLAGEFPLSYEMFEKSAGMFLKDKDTLSYYFLLNDMAFEKAMQNDSCGCVQLLQLIDKNVSSSDIFASTTLTRAELFLQSQHYDSAIYYAGKLQDIGYHIATGFLTKAQAYSFMGQRDSAIYYANIVLEYTHSTYDINNALYILTNDDLSKDNDAIRQTAAERSDVQKSIEIRRSKLSQAVQLLEQDLERIPDRRWVYSILLTLIVVGISILIYVHYKRKKQELLTQKIVMLQRATSAIQEQNNELTEHYQKSHNQIEMDINHRCSMLRDNDKIIKTLAWKNFNKMCALVDKQFFLLASKLRSKQLLNETEIRLCVLTLLDCGYEQMAELLYRSSTSIGTLKLRVAKKLGTSSKQLRNYLIDNVCLK